MEVSVLLQAKLATHLRDRNGEPSERHATELQMRRIITHFLGDVSFEANSLRQIADALDQGQGQEQPDSNSNDATLGDHYSVDLLSTSTMRVSNTRTTRCPS